MPPTQASSWFSSGGVCIPPGSPCVRVRNDPGEMPHWRRVELPAGILPLKRIWIKLRGSLVLSEMAWLRSVMEHVGGTLIVMVCPSNSLTRIWISSSTTVVFSREGLFGEPEQALMPYSFFRRSKSSSCKLRSREADAWSELRPYSRSSVR